MANRKIIIGSRGSKLALWQAEWVKTRLASIHPEIELSIQIIKTSGDRNQVSPLSTIGGQGVFTKEIEDALLARQIDLAVHSLKDLPTTTPSELTIAAITEREDPRDALVLPLGLTEQRSISIGTMANGMRVGTSSPRRLAQLKNRRPDIECVELRGNVDTRLRKLDEGEYDAVVLACAGLQRLGLESRISHAIPPDEMTPAVGQGALGIECRAGDSEVLNLVQPLDHWMTRSACTAERAMLKGLGGGCQLPIAGHATVVLETLNLTGLVASVSGHTVVRESISGDANNAASLGEELSARLMSQGAELILAES